MSIINHNYLIKVEPNTILWRYMDLEKYESILKEQALFFCRDDKFSDPFEGSIPKKVVEARKKMIQEYSKKYEYSFNKEKIEKDEKDNEGFSIRHKLFKRGTIVNCWHINMNESDAMWKLYLKTNEGVAIQTSADSIYKAFRDSIEDVKLSKVRYIDYDHDIWYHPVDYPIKPYNFLIPLIHKRVEFKQENELRIFHEIIEAQNDDTYWDKQPNHIGKFISVKIDKLIHKVILPPTTDNKVELEVKKITSLFKFNFIIERSKLCNEPYF